MNQSHTMQSLLALAVLFLVASIAGLMALSFTTTVRRRANDVLLVLGCLAGGFVLILSTFAGPKLLFAALIVSICCAIAAFLIRDPPSDGWFDRVGFFIVTSFISWWIADQLPVYSLSLRGDKELFKICYWISSGVSPCAIAFILWIWRDSRLRPQTDKNLG